MRGQVQRIGVKLETVTLSELAGSFFRVDLRGHLTRRRTDGPFTQEAIHRDSSVEFTRNDNTDPAIPYAAKRVGARYVDVYGVVEV